MSVFESSHGSLNFGNVFLPMYKVMLNGDFDT